VRTAVVLGAGGLVGQAFSTGVLSALEELTDFDARSADLLVGTSAGSLVAAALAAGLSGRDMAAEALGAPVSADGRRLREAGRARRLPREPEAALPVSGPRPLAPGALLAAVRRPWAVRPGALASSLLPAGKVSTQGISRNVQGMHTAGWPDRELRICAVRARDGRRVVFGSPGAPEVDVGTAVAASCAIPGWFRPVVAHGETYVDGGAHSPTNADVTLASRPELVVIVSPMSYSRGAGRGRPRPDLAVRLAVRRYLAREVRTLRRAGAQVVTLQPTVTDLAAMGLNPMDSGRGAQVVRTATASVRSRLEAQPRLVELLAQA
jgi:NTE family protein